MIIKIKRFPSSYGLNIPSKAYAGDAGFDLRSTEDVTIKRGGRARIGCGFAFELPAGYVGLLLPRSGAACRGIVLGNVVGVIDSSYRGEIIMVLDNNGRAPHIVRKGDALAQLVVVQTFIGEIVEVKGLTETSRGECGFGSSDIPNIGG